MPLISLYFLLILQLLPWIALVIPLSLLPIPSLHPLFEVIIFVGLLARCLLIIAFLAPVIVALGSTLFLLAVILLVLRLLTLRAILVTVFLVVFCPVIWLILLHALLAALSVLLVIRYVVVVAIGL